MTIEEDSWVSAILDAAEMANLSANERLNNIGEMMTQLDYYLGIKCHLAEAHAKGHAKGHAEGHAEGEANKSREIARAMLAQKLDIDVIKTCTGLSEEVILAL